MKSVESTNSYMCTRISALMIEWNQNGYNGDKNNEIDSHVHIMARNSELTTQYLK